MDDLHITGARIVDPANSIDSIADLAVSQGRIRAVGDLAGSTATSSVDGTDLLLLPGLVDMHTHLHSGGTFWGMDPDPVAWYTGVTTWVDAGSVGAYGLRGLIETSSRFAVNSAILLHVSAQGLSARTGEARDLAYIDIDAAVTAIRQNPTMIRGLKVRMDSSTVGDNGLAPLQMAIEIGEETQRPVMVHIGRGPFGLDEVVDLLRPGDIITHCAGRAARGIMTRGPVQDSLVAAYDRGVIFDLGHGAGGFSFDVIDAYLEQGLPPHVISSDLHVLCASGPAFDLPTVMSKLLASGMSLESVIAATTATPGQVLGLQAGTLSPGSSADFGLFVLEEGEFVTGDVHGKFRTARERFRNVATYVGGNPLPPAFPQAPPPWVDLSDAQRTALVAREEQLRAMLSEPLVHPSEVKNQIPPRNA